MGDSPGLQAWAAIMGPTGAAGGVTFPLRVSVMESLRGTVDFLEPVFPSRSHALFPQTQELGTPATLFTYFAAPSLARGLEVMSRGAEAEAEVLIFGKIRGARSLGKAGGPWREGDEEILQLSCRCISCHRPGQGNSGGGELGVGIGLVPRTCCFPPKTSGSSRKKF